MALKIKKPHPNSAFLNKLKEGMLKGGCCKFSMNIPRPIHKKFRIKALKEGKEMKDILMPTILKYIEESE